MKPHRALVIRRAAPVRGILTDDRPSQDSEAARHAQTRRLQRCPLFRDVGVAQVQEVLESSGMRRVRKGGFYFRQGDRASEAYVLMRGRVKLVRIGSDMRRGILRFVTPLEPFGHEAALGGTARVSSAQASEDSEALVWPATTLVRIMASRPVIAHNSLRFLAGCVQEKWERLHALLTESLEQRTVRALVVLGTRLGRTADGGNAIELRLPRQDLAAFVGATPYAMSRIVSRWRRRGVIDAGRGWVVIWPRRLATMVRAPGLLPGQR